LLRDYVPANPVVFTRGATSHSGGAQIYLKREDLLHTGAHKINNAIGQALLARLMGKSLLARPGQAARRRNRDRMRFGFGFRVSFDMGAQDVRDNRSTYSECNSRR